MKKIGQNVGVPFQLSANRPARGGGCTLGNISASHGSVSSVDIGLAQLAMHSAVETGGAADTEYAVKAFTAFFEE
jgi:aspartyl aminopeptidase